MNKLYYAMHKGFAEPILDMFPGASWHGEFRVVGAPPQNFQGETLDLYLAGFDETGENGLTPVQFKALVDVKAAEVFTGKLIIMTKPQGKWLEKNHPAFMTEVVEI